MVNRGKLKQTNELLKLFTLSLFYFKTKVANAFCIDKIFVFFLNVFTTVGVCELETHIFSSESKSKFPAVSTEK